MQRNTVLLLLLVSNQHLLFKQASHSNISKLPRVICDTSNFSEIRETFLSSLLFNNILFCRSRSRLKSRQIFLLLSFPKTSTLSNLVYSKRDTKSFIP